MQTKSPQHHQSPRPRPPPSPDSPNSPLRHLNALTDSSRLNSVIEITQNLFVCGTPRNRNGSFGGGAYHPQYRHPYENELVFNKKQSQQLNHRHWSLNLPMMEDGMEKEEEGVECGGIEVDTENSLKAAYELYRV